MHLVINTVDASGSSSQISQPAASSSMSMPADKDGQCRELVFKWAKTFSLVSSFDKEACAQFCEWLSPFPTFTSQLST